MSIESYERMFRELGEQIAAITKIREGYRLMSKSAQRSAELKDISETIKRIRSAQRQLAKLHGRERKKSGLRGPSPLLKRLA